MIKKIFFLFTIVLGSISLSCAAVQTDIDGFEISEPSESQVLALGKIYNGLIEFSYIDDEDIFIWSGDDKEKFDQLCGINIVWEDREIHTDYSQSPSETLIKRTGDCEDFSILFVSAARNLGISARVCGGYFCSYEKDLKGKHVWVEVYFKERWWQVEPTGNVKKDGVILDPVPFARFFDGSLNDTYKAQFVFDEKKMIGQWMFDFQIEESIQKEQEIRLRDLINGFKIVKGRDPDIRELQEIVRISRGVAEHIINLTLQKAPEDFRELIQPNDPGLKAWMKKQGVRVR